MYTLLLLLRKTDHSTVNSPWWFVSSATACGTLYLENDSPTVENREGLRDRDTDRDTDRYRDTDRDRDRDAGRVTGIQTVTQ